MAEGKDSATVCIKGNGSRSHPTMLQLNTDQSLCGPVTDVDSGQILRLEKCFNLSVEFKPCIVSVSSTTLAPGKETIQLRYQ